MWLLVGVAGINYLLAKCGSLIVVMSWNFVFQKKVVFLD
jgi:putative flippase GtrA